MHPAYFETRFRSDSPVPIWPREFVIVSAYATTGETWSEAENQAGDDALRAELRSRGCWLARLIGFSPTTYHAEPSWAAELSLKEARDLGATFRQDAIYHVLGDRLFVVGCDRDAIPRLAGRFRERLDHEN